MHSQIIGLRVAGTIFGIMSLGQLVRLLARVEVLVAGHPMPLWPSALAAVILGGRSLIKDLQEGSCDKTQQAPFSSNRKGPHRLFILSCDICQRQVTIDCQALFLSVSTEKLEFRADDPLLG